MGNKISAFVSIPEIFTKKLLHRTNYFHKNHYLNSKKFCIKCQSSNNYKEWLDSILSTRKPTDKKYLDKWRKVGVNLIKGLPFPSNSDESWKLTSLDRILEKRFSPSESNDEVHDLDEYFKNETEPRIVFVNGVYSAELSDLTSLDQNVFLGDLNNYPKEEEENILEFLSKGESGISGGFFPTLNIACLSDIYVLSIPSFLELKNPINIFYISSDSTNIASFNHRLIVISGENSKSKVIEQHIGTELSEYFENTAVSILVKENSKLDYYLINECSKKSNSINSIHADIKDNSLLNFSTISLGGLLSRVNLGIDINGTQCECNVQGTSIAKEKQTIDFHSRISHNLPNSESSQLQKILLTDNAHGVFAGKIQVQHGADNTNSDQLCKTLLLSPYSRVDALPILEINNENVKCTHGSTVSDLNDNQMFYLQSRGILEKDAKKLLTVGFVNEMVNNYPQRLKEKIIKQLNDLM